MHFSGQMTGGDGLFGDREVSVTWHFGKSSARRLDNRLGVGLRQQLTFLGNNSGFMQLAVELLFTHRALPMLRQLS